MNKAAWSRFILFKCFSFFCSKQRHNKLWRSHSDSDLSEHHEPLSKSYAQPHSLGRSDPHNQASITPGSSVKDLLESLGTSAITGKDPQAGVRSSQPGSSSCGGASDLSGGAENGSLEAPSQANKAPSRQLDSPTAGYVSSSPPLSNGLCDSEEQPSCPPLYQPRAATVVPEPQRTDINVAQSVLVGQPHPPPSVHHLSPPPSPAPACADGAVEAQAPSSEIKPEPVSAETSQQCPVLIRNADGDQQARGSSPGGDAAAPTPSSDNPVSQPNAIPQDNVLLFGHSADHINFFSARAKFKGMSDDGKTLPKSSAKEHLPLTHEVPTSEGNEEEKSKVTCFSLINKRTASALGGVRIKLQLWCQVAACLDFLFFSRLHWCKGELGLSSSSFCSRSLRF